MKSCQKNLKEHTSKELDSEDVLDLGASSRLLPEAAAAAAAAAAGGNGGAGEELFEGGKKMMITLAIKCHFVSQT